MRKIELNKYWMWIILLALNFQLKAQEGIDTLMIREMKIKRITVFVKLPILPNKTMDDSCKLDVYEYDTSARLIYQYNNTKCYGWGDLVESYHFYNALGKLDHTTQKTQNRLVNINYEYNSKGDIIKIIQSSPQEPDTLFTNNEYVYDKKGKVSQMTTTSIYSIDTGKTIYKYTYDEADNLKELNTYTADNKLIQKETFEITPISKKLLEFSTEVKLPKPSFTKGWNYYNFDAQLIKTQFNNNTWSELFYSENGFLELNLFYNMEGKLNSHKSYFYEFHDRVK